MLITCLWRLEIHIHFPTKDGRPHPNEDLYCLFGPLSLHHPHACWHCHLLPCHWLRPPGILSSKRKLHDQLHAGLKLKDRM